MLGIRDLAIFHAFERRVRAHEPVAIPMEIIQRIGCVLSIYGSLVTLLSEERTSAWLRSQNTHPLFGGKSALATMMTGEFDDLRKVVNYLLGQIYGGW